jgi:putative lipid kinase YegS-like protein
VQLLPPRSVEVANLSRTGPALPISPAAEPDDGLLDVVFVFASDRKRMLSWTDPEGRFPAVTVRRGTQRLTTQKRN